MKFERAAAVVALGAVAEASSSEWGTWDPTTTTTTTTWDWPEDPSTSSTTPGVWDPWTTSSTTTTTTTTPMVWDPWTTTTTTTDPAVWDPWTSSSTTKTKTTTTTAETAWGTWNPKDPACKPPTETAWEVSTLTSTATSTSTVYTTLGWKGTGPAPVAVTTETVTVWPGSDPVDPGTGTWSGNWPMFTTVTSAGATFTLTGWTGQPTTCTKDGKTLTLTGGWPSDPTGDWTTDPGTVTGGWPDPTGGSWPDPTGGAWPSDPLTGWGPGVTSVIGTNDGAGWTMTVDTTQSTWSDAAPTYTQGSNCTTQPFPTATNQCNSPADRSTWCTVGGKSYDIDTNYYQECPNTGRVVKYNFEITNTTVNYDGDDRLGLLINGGNLGPLIEANWGDTVQITVTNSMTDNGTAIHWHGIRQFGTNSQDGVPGISECAIAPGSTRTYTWAACQYGTSWYHSHWLTQYGDGIKGPMIIHGPATANYDFDMGPVVVSDLFNQTAADTYYQISHFGPGGSSNYLLNGHNVKPDLSAGQHTLWTITPGKKHLFRFVNSAAQNMWSLHFDSHVMEVIAVDFVPIVPYTTDWLDIAIGQRYDVIITADQAVDSYFLRAVTQLACPSSCDNTGLGSANGIIQYLGAPEGVLPTSTAGNKTLADFAICQDEPVASLVPHVALGAGTKDAFDSQASTLPAGNVAFVATSDDGRVFRWFLNGGTINVNYTQPTLQSLADVGANDTISNAVYLRNEADSWVYFVIQNQFFAAHPMHLHGHDFSLLGQGLGIFSAANGESTLNFINPPRRDTAMLEGNGWTVIGFQTDNPGAWLMHCHIVWHVDGGLAMQFVERPDDINAGQYITSDFQDECSSYSSYAAASPDRVPTGGESGLRRRGWFEPEVMGPGGDVVRRSNKQEKRYLENYVKRGLGDGYKPRHGARR